MSTGISTVNITDPTLLTLHQQRESTFATIEKEKNGALPEYQKSFDGIAGFATAIRTRGKSFQEGTVNPVPAKGLLETEKETTLRQYWKYSETLEKVGQLSDSISKAIVFLTPKARTYSEETSLKQHTSLYEQTKASEKTCLDYLGKLNGMLTDTKGLQTRMHTALSDRDLNWSIQRFCGIVDNDGKPLPGLDRGWNYASNSYVASWVMKPPSIPKPTISPALAQELASVPAQVKEQSQPQDPLIPKSDQTKDDAEQDRWCC